MANPPVVSEPLSYPSDDAEFVTGLFRPSCCVVCLGRRLVAIGCSLVRPVERCGWYRWSCGRPWRRREVAPYILLLGRRLVAEVLVGVVSTRAGRPVVVLVRLLPVACRSVKGNEKIPLVLNHQLIKNSELAQVLRNCVIGRYSQQKLLRAKGTEVAQP